MRIAMVGLGRMGGDMTRRLLRAGHEVVAYDLDPDAVAAVAAEGASGVDSLSQVVAALDAPRTVWLMLPIGAVESTLQALTGLLEPGDLVVDGANSHWRDDKGRAARLAQHGVQFVDVGVSGGIWGLERGYCLMIGGEPEAVSRLEPLFVDLAPGVAAAPRGKGRTGEPSTAEQGWYHCGTTGAGHFVKMVHNGIEYGLMAAYAEGLSMLEAASKEFVVEDHLPDLPREPQYYHYDIDTAEVAELWRRGSVIGSWLLDLTAEALRDDPQLRSYEAFVADSGEGRWAVQAAIDMGVPATVTAAALFSRFVSRGRGDFCDRTVAAMRAAFGGHLEAMPSD